MEWLYVIQKSKTWLIKSAFDIVSRVAIKMFILHRVNIYTSVESLYGAVARINNMWSSQHRLSHLLPPKHTGPYNLRNNKVYELPHFRTNRFRYSCILAMCSQSFCSSIAYNFPLINNIRFYASTLYFYYSFRLL